MPVDPIEGLRNPGQEGDGFPLLSVRNLVTRFKTRAYNIRAVNGISYDLHFRESLGIVGESGCGKTVSALSILKVLPVPPAEITADEITLCGIDITNADQAAMQKIRGKHIGMIFQDPMTSLNPVLTVGFQVEETIVEHLAVTNREARKRTEDLLDLVGIPEARKRMKQYPHQFSGGMRQRAMIAMALSCNPRILIADEPTTALDVTIQAKILDIIKHLTQKLGMGLIMISHNLGLIADICDQVVVMYAGYIVEQASAVEIYKRPAHPYTRGLLKCIPQIDRDIQQELEHIEGSPPDLASLSEDCPFMDRCKDNCARSGIPPLYETGPRHYVRCWRAEP